MSMLTREQKMLLGELGSGSRGWLVGEEAREAVRDALFDVSVSGDVQNDLLGQIADLTEKLASEVQDRSTAQLRAKEAEAYAVDQRHTIDDLLAQVGQASRTIHDLTARAASAEGTIERLESENEGVKTLSQQLALANSEKAQLTRQLAAAEADGHRLLNELAACRKKSSEAHNELNNLVDIREQRDRTEARLQEALAQLKKANEERDQAAAEKSRFALQAKEQGDRAAQVETSLATIRNIVAEALK